MNSAINLSLFAYKRRGSCLSAHTSGKENLPSEPHDRLLPRPPIDAPPARGHTPTASRSRASVVPETPDKEWPLSSSSSPQGAVRMAQARGRRKRNRLDSSSDEETVSRDSVSLFSNTVTCKRRKRNGEITGREMQEEGTSRKEEERKQKICLTEERVVHPQKKVQCNMSHRTVKRKNGRIGKGEAVNLCIDTNSESEEEEEEEIEEEAEVESRPVCAAQKEERIATTVAERKRRKPRKGAARTLLPAPPTGGWFTRRGRSRVSHSPQDKERDVVRLKEMFPQHEETYLRSRLEQCCSVEEAIAEILATEGRVMHVDKIDSTQWPSGLHVKQ